MNSIIVTLANFSGIFFVPPTSTFTTYNVWHSIQNEIHQQLASQKAYEENFNYLRKTLFNKDWSLTMNKYAGYDPIIFDKFYKGYKPKTILTRTPFNVNVQVPKTLDWRNSTIVGPVKDQGQCGSCWAFSAVSALESQVMKVLNKSVSLSEQDMVDCVKNIGSSGCCDGCMGGEMYSVYQYLLDNQNGQDDTEKQYPYVGVDQDCNTLPSSVNNVKITNYVTLPVADEEAMVKALFLVGPLSVGVDANVDWQLYEKGIYNPTPEQCSTDPDDQDHGVTVVGYGSENGLDYWIIRNSWGNDWGEKGYMRLAKGTNACGVANSVIYPIVTKSYGQNQCLNSHPECPSEVCYTDCPCACFIPSSASPCLCSAATCSC